MSKPWHMSCTLQGWNDLGIAAVMSSFCEEFGERKKSRD